MPVRPTEGRIPWSAMIFAYSADVYWVGSAGRRNSLIGRVLMMAVGYGGVETSGASEGLRCQWRADRALGL